MPDVAIEKNKLWTTPMRDLLRGRVTGRLDWQSRLAAAGLPTSVAELIAAVVKHTRLWRLEKAAVADELLAHFQDGLTAGTSAAELVERFGNERTAAKLIRRSKRRGRPLLWHAWKYSFRATAALVLIYSIFLIRFCIARPTISVDYVSRLNAPILQTPEADRAWPLWRKAILATVDGVQNGSLHFPDATGNNRDKVPWADTARWLDSHADAMEIARQAGTKPSLGFVLGAGGSIDDPQMCFPPSSDPRQPIISLLLPHLNPLREMSVILSFDARRAAELHDGARLQADLLAMHGLARQLRTADGIVVTQMVGLSINGAANDRLQHILRDHADIFSDAQLIQLAHMLSGPRVAADLMSISGERIFFSDILQRVYTDNGNGDGRLTRKGAQIIPTLLAGSNEARDMGLWIIASTVPLATASRAELQAKYDRLIEESEANFHQPLRLVDGRSVDSQLIALHISPVNNLRYALLCTMFPSSENLQSSCERYLGNRDGTLVAISLELYRRRHGGYPATLSELTPDLLPDIPADRITGEAIKYGLIEGKPVVYSVGEDRIDDGGKRLAPHTPWVAGWNLKPADAPRGDWVLYPPDPADDE